MIVSFYLLVIFLIEFRQTIVYLAGGFLRFFNIVFCLGFGEAAGFVGVHIFFFMKDIPRLSVTCYRCFYPYHTPRYSKYIY